MGIFKDYGWTTHISIDKDKARAFWLEYIALCEKHRLTLTASMNNKKSITCIDEAGFVDSVYVNPPIEENGLYTEEEWEEFPLWARFR
jgi:hypothetical protein